LIEPTGFIVNSRLAAAQLERACSILNLVWIRDRTGSIPGEYFFLEFGDLISVLTGY